jgi:hypothetical protein
MIENQGFPLERKNAMKRLLFAITFLAIIALVACAPAAAPVPTMAPPPAQPPVPSAPPVAESGARQLQLTATDSTTNVPSAASAERMIVYNVHLSLEVQDADKASSDIAAIAAQFKGYVAGSNLTRDAKGRMHGTITLRIPAESLDAAQKQIEAVGLKVLSRNKDSQDVTDQYTDLNAKLKNAMAAETELRELLRTVRERSNKAEEILAVYNRLNEVQQEIERYKGQMNVLEKTTALATLTIELVPHEQVQVLEPDTWVPNRTAAQALRTLVQALQGLTDLTIWLVLLLLPILIVLLIPFVVLALIVRTILRRRGKEKKAAPT